MPDRDATLAAYEAHAATYIARTSGRQSPLVALLVDALRPGSSVLEIGSGPGTDADALERAGLEVDRTDATVAFVDRLIADGHSARRLNALTDDFGSRYGAVFASAVFLHFPPPELRRVLRKTWNAVEPDGLLAMSVKEGDGEEWSTAKLGAPRYFRYWRWPELERLLQEEGWAAQRRLSNSDATGQPWLTVLAVRNPDRGQPHSPAPETAAGGRRQAARVGKIGLQQVFSAVLSSAWQVREHCRPSSTLCTQGNVV